MGIFHFRLATLLELREDERTYAFQALADAQHQLDRLRTRIAQLNEQRAAVCSRMRSLSRAGNVDIAALRAAHEHHGQLKSELAAENLRLLVLDREIEQRRQALVAADQQVQILEKLRGRQAERHRIAERRRELRACG
jgi:flagellar protein FliJ